MKMSWKWILHKSLSLFVLHVYDNIFSYSRKWEKVFPPNFKKLISSEKKRASRVFILLLSRKKYKKSEHKIKSPFDLLLKKQLFIVNYKKY